MKVYVIMHYTNKGEAEVHEVFDNKEAAESYMNCFADYYVQMFEKEVKSVNTYAPKYIVRTVYPHDDESVCCFLPDTEDHIKFILDHTSFEVYASNPKWNPEPNVFLEIELVVNSKEVGDNFANLCNKTLAKARTMLSIHSFEEIKEFITSTLKPIMEEISTKTL
jgi:hypothetical protein